MESLAALDWGSGLADVYSPKLPALFERVLLTTMS
jgi:hypothetical protein